MKAPQYKFYTLVLSRVKLAVVETRKRYGHAQCGTRMESGNVTVRVRTQARGYGPCAEVANLVTADEALVTCNSYRRRLLRP